MPKNPIEVYISKQPEASRAHLNKVRDTIRKAIPEAEEVISYQIPAYRLKEGMVLYFAGWKEHYSMYPATEHVVQEVGEALARYKVSKGTLKFPLDEPVPVRLIGKFSKLRAAEVKARAAEKKAAKKAATS